MQQAEERHEPERVMHAQRSGALGQQVKQAGLGPGSDARRELPGQVGSRGNAELVAGELGDLEIFVGLEDAAAEHGGAGQQQGEQRQVIGQAGVVGGGHGSRSIA